MSELFGSVVPFGDSLDIDESEMSVVVPFARGGRPDHIGDVLEVGGIVTDYHEANPIVLYEHGKSKETSLPIAKAQDPAGNYTVQIDERNQVAKGKAFFYQGNDEHGGFCQQLFALVASGFVRGGSIGYLVRQARPSGIGDGKHLLSITMTEFSIVVVPCNGTTLVGKNLDDMEEWQEAARSLLSYGRLCGEPLAPVLCKSLREACSLTYCPTSEHGGVWVDEAASIRNVRRKYQFKNLADNAAKRQRQIAELGDAVDRLDFAVDPIAALRQGSERRANQLGELNDLAERLGRLL